VEVAREVQLGQVQQLGRELEGEHALVRTLHLLAAHQSDLDAQSDVLAN